MRKMTIIVALALLAPATAALAQESEPATFTTTETFEGLLGCSAAVGPLSIADRCSTTATFEYGPQHDDHVAMDVTLTYEAPLGAQLELRFAGPPAERVSGASPATASYGSDAFSGNAFRAGAEVRAANGHVAMDVPFTVEIVYTYLGEAPVEAATAATAGADVEPETGVIGNGSETVVYEGFIGCSIGGGPAPLRMSDRCDGDTIVPVEPSHPVESMDVELVWDDPAVELQWLFAGPPAESHQGASPLTKSYGSDDLTIAGPWDGSATVRAGFGAAIDLPFTMTITYHYL